MSEARKDALPHIVEFDGLRGYLAWWVVFYHTHIFSGLGDLNIRPVALTIGQGHLAVPLFFTLSGFVIAYLEDARREPYRAFLVRRFFRLAPVYYLVLALGIYDAARAGTYGDRLWAHVLAHVTMLHGAVPASVLPGSLHALDSVAWSVTVEWQFYLLAPLLVLAIRRSSTWAMGVLAFAVASYALNKIPALAVDEASTVFQRGGAFGTGLGSFYLFKFATRNVGVVRGAVPYLLPFALAVAWACGGPLIHTGPIWVVVLAAVLSYYCGAETAVTRPLRLALGAPLMAWLGRLSYVTYLCHSRVLGVVEGWFAPYAFAQGPWARFLLLVVVGYPLVALVSEVIHRLVEVPGILVGKRLVARYGPRWSAPVPAIAAAEAEAAGTGQAS